MLALLSGRAHMVLTGLVVRAPDGRSAERVVETRVQFKRVDLGGGRLHRRRRVARRLGGYKIHQRAGAFVTGLRGSYSSVVGLPLYETVGLLTGLGWRA